MPKRTHSGSYSGKFENLCHLVTEFEDFNWLTIDRAEQVPAIYFRNVLGSAFYSGKLTDLEPDLVDAIARTLMPSSCEAFFRNNSLPFTHRDYYLSKVYQYAYDALVSGRFCYGEEADRRLTTELEKIPNDFLPRLHETFDVQHFFLWTRPYDKNGGRGLLHSLRLESLLVTCRCRRRANPRVRRLANAFALSRRRAVSPGKTSQTNPKFRAGGSTKSPTQGLSHLLKRGKN